MYCQFFFKPKIFVLIKLLYIAISHELIVCLPTHTNLSNMITLMIYVSLTLSLSQIILISEINRSSISEECEIYSHISSEEGCA